mmetsp:Transcript_56109/g.93514  ORF Transcript_56109/g.93514 Transcript_56109/m.93514 type:complete len:447 (+) Transcript_56109:45-1385(+)
MDEDQTNTVEANGKTTDNADATANSALQALRSWFSDHFWVGQTFSRTQSQRVLDVNAPWYIRHRKKVSILVPLLLTHIIWWSVAIRYDLFHVFVERINGIARYYMSITMVFGSFIAGATSEGGASVAFPVMTLAFGIKPSIARDFSFMIQSVGMSAAAFSILFMRVQIEWRSVLYCSIGGVLGIVLCLQSISHHLPPPFSKMYFVSIWFSFAFSLFWLNRYHDRKVYNTIPRWADGVFLTVLKSWGSPIAFNWKAITLVLGGFIGGIFSGIAGSGIDICSFAMLTLLFRVSEKTATPTSVVLMAINTCAGFFYRQCVMNEIVLDSWQYFFVCIPIVVIGAPCGSVIGSYLHREILAMFVYLTDTVQLIAAFIIVKPWNISTVLLVTSIVFIIAGGIIFSIIANLGLRVMNQIEQSGGDREAEGIIDCQDMTKVSSASASEIKVTRQ